MPLLVIGCVNLVIYISVVNLVGRRDWYVLFRHGQMDLLDNTNLNYNAFITTYFWNSREPGEPSSKQVVESVSENR